VVRSGSVTTCSAAGIVGGNPAKIQIPQSTPEQDKVLGSLFHRHVRMVLKPSGVSPISYPILLHRHVRMVLKPSGVSPISYPIQYGGSFGAINYARGYRIEIPA
jgi:hypothetical protein